MLLVGSFNQEKALVGDFKTSRNIRQPSFQALVNTLDEWIVETYQLYLGRYSKLSRFAFVWLLSFLLHARCAPSLGAAAGFEILIFYWDWLSSKQCP